MKEIWSNVWIAIKALCENHYVDVKSAVKELGINVCKALFSFLKAIWTILTAIITGILSIVGGGLVATGKFLFDKWF